MKWRSYISTTDWQYNLLVTLAFFIPLHKRIIPFLIISSAVVAIIKSVRDRKLYRESEIFPLFLLMSLYLLHLAGISLTRFPRDAWTEMEIKASFIAFPLLALVLPRIKVHHVQKIADAFSTGALLFMVFSICYGIYMSVATADWTHLSYSKLGIYFHPTYMAVYQCMALLWMFIRAGQMRHIYGSTIIHWVIASILTVYITMLASRAGILSVPIVIAVWIWSERHNRLRLKNAAINSVVVLSVFSASIFFLPYTLGRIREAVDNAAHVSDTIADHKGAVSSTGLRKVTMTAAWELLSTHPLGVGTGNVTPELVKIYEAKGEEKAAKKELNAHNQFLQTGAETGWAGLFLLTAFLWILWKSARASGNLFFRGFIILCVFNFLFESFLEVQAGIVFFCFWSLVFLKADAD
ncbi:MAG: O-antigen ligase family protein [Crocinitomicaceae bacterium]|nr:O-antigen ligase family protein [Crocinitomicaceae bacterium]